MTVLSRFLSKLKAKPKTLEQRLAELDQSGMVLAQLLVLAADHVRLEGGRVGRERLRRDRLRRRHLRPRLGPFSSYISLSTHEKMMLADELSFCLIWHWFEAPRSMRE